MHRWNFIGLHLLALRVLVRVLLQVGARGIQTLVHLLLVIAIAPGTLDDDPAILQVRMFLEMRIVPHDKLLIRWVLEWALRTVHEGVHVVALELQRGQSWHDDPRSFHRVLLLAQGQILLLHRL